MERLQGLSLLLAALAGMQFSSAGTLQYSGNFTTDDNVVIIPFAVSVGSTITMQTTSFGDGSAGFEPVLSLFDMLGNPLNQDASGGTAPGSCGGRAIDPVSSFCLDALIQTFLNPGNYQLALSESDNIPGGTLADGFPEAGNGNFTGPNFGCGSGGFFLFDCSQRNNNWALSISGDGVVPEPAGALLTASGIIAILWGRTRRSRRNQN